MGLRFWFSIENIINARNLLTISIMWVFSVLSLTDLIVDHYYDVAVTLIYLVVIKYHRSKHSGVKEKKRKEIPAWLLATIHLLKFKHFIVACSSPPWLLSNV